MQIAYMITVIALIHPNPQIVYPLLQGISLHRADITTGYHRMLRCEHMDLEHRRILVLILIGTSLP
jgi:hypothetical protein